MHGRRERQIQALLQRDGDCCHYCRERLTAETWTREHLVPRCQGGSNRRSNLVLACSHCNHSRSSRPYELFKAAMDRWLSGEGPDPRGERKRTTGGLQAPAEDGLQRPPARKRDGYRRPEAADCPACQAERRCGDPFAYCVRHAPVVGCRLVEPGLPDDGEPRF